MWCSPAGPHDLMSIRRPDRMVSQGGRLAVRSPLDAQRLQTVGIIGTGVMGKGIAAANLCAGRTVRISDAQSETAAAAVRELQDVGDAGHMPRPHFLRTTSLPQISVAACDADLADADLIIEAVTEDVAIKQEVLSRIERHMRPDAILATNSSCIPMGTLADACADPTRFCGLHFCHPVHERPLVEVVASDRTSAQTMDRVFRYATSLGKSPIIVRDSPGFLLNRLLLAHLNESLELLLEGVTVPQLDTAALEFGMPCGPLGQIDEYGIDVALAVGRRLFWAFPDRVIPSELLIAMHKAGRRGRKSGSGFFATPRDMKRGCLDPHAQELIRERQRGIGKHSAEIVQRRLLLPMLLEATRILDEALVEGPEIIDAALRDGLGMTSAYRGLLGWADSVGAVTLLEWLRPLEALGKRFHPTSRLQNMATAGQCFLT